MTTPITISAAAPRDAAMNAEVPYLLVNPPLTDPTYPYHSISYLVGSTSALGFTNFRCEDANINALNYLTRPAVVSGLLAEAARVRTELEACQALTRADELRYQYALSATGLSADFMQRALRVFRTPESFYDYPRYQDAAMAARRFVNLLSLRTVPGVFSGYSLRTNGPVNYLSKADLTDQALLDQVTGAFSGYLDGPFAELLELMPLPRSSAIARGLSWRELEGGREHLPGGDNSPVEPALRSRIRRNVVGRPFVGGVDSSHTLLYFGRYGKSLVPTETRRGEPSDDRIAREHLITIPFANLDEFCSAADMAAAHVESLRRDNHVGYAEMSAWLSAPGSARPGRSLAVLMPGGATAGFGQPAGDVDSDKVMLALRSLLNPATQVGR